MKLFNLFIDESGISNPKVEQSKTYILCGCVVKEDERDQMKIKADQIKYKYWGNTEIILHSREIFRKQGEFAIFKDKKVYESFCKDLFDFLTNSHYFLLFVIVNKEKARKDNWNDIKVYSETATIMVRNYLLSLLAQEDTKGRLVAESATSVKDFSFHKAASYYLANGIKELKVTCDDVQDALTEISFVTKHNHDIEEQIADIMAYGAKLKFLKVKQADMNDYDKKLLAILNMKLFRMHPDTAGKKKQFHSQIESFKIIP